LVPADVAGISQTRNTTPPTTSLALTGSNVLKLLFSGVLLIAAGLLLVDLRKYRRQTS
jgi:LPXTG-motif cell wall-anchored protein